MPNHSKNSARQTIPTLVHYTTDQRPRAFVDTRHGSVLSRSQPLWVESRGQLAYLEVSVWAVADVVPNPAALRAPLGISTPCEGWCEPLVYPRHRLYVIADAKLDLARSINALLMWIAIVHDPGGDRNKL